LLFLWGAYRHQRRLFWGILPMVVMTPIACVYLRYHYVVDTLAGALLALFVSRVTPRVIDGYERAHGFGDGPAAPAPPTNPAPAA
jgi:membrane-associated phospholipid phosphatase